MSLVVQETIVLTTEQVFYLLLNFISLDEDFGLHPAILHRFPVVSTLVLKKALKRLLRIFSNNAIVTRYNAIVTRYNAIVTRYNAIVTRYNAIVTRYNTHRPNLIMRCPK
ncbi:MAG: hypothetical protein ACR2LR_00005, partial [Hassallia sp.]